MLSPAVVQYIIPWLCVKHFGLEEASENGQIEFKRYHYKVKAAEFYMLNGAGHCNFRVPVYD